MADHPGKTDKDKLQLSPLGSTLKPPGRPPEGSAPGLFTRTGPVSLGAQQRGVLTLGSIGGKTGTTHLPSVSATPPSMPPARSAEYIPDQSPPPMEALPKVEPMPSLPPADYIRETEKKGGSVASGPTSWSPATYKPQIDHSSFVHPSAVVLGNVIISPKVFIAPGALIRGDNEEPIYIGEGSNVQEGAVIRDLPSRRSGVVDKKRLVDVDGVDYSVYIGRGVSICPQAQVHGPARIEDGVYLGMQSLVFWARIGKGVVVEPDCLVMNVSVSSGVFIPAGLKLTNQKLVSDLPPLTSRYRFYGIATEVGGDYLELLRAYAASLV
jgi:carbonic anhydrase/acetyltransferase-like protein (isoleucine patch superfamily)